MSMMRRLLDRLGVRDGVWLVLQDESPHNTVLGVFGDRDKAAAFADEVGGQFGNGVICAEYKIGYRFNSGGERYREPLL
jgi:hypothetical protein